MWRGGSGQVVVVVGGGSLSWPSGGREGAQCRSDLVVIHSRTAEGES